MTPPYRSNWGRTRPTTNASFSSEPPKERKTPEPFLQHDPGDECDCDQLELDMPATRKCRACGSTRPNLCEWEANGAHGIERPTHRPSTCLNAYDPATSPWPLAY